MSCSDACWTNVDCAVCGRWKTPRGRSVPLEMAGSRCDDDCPGYALDPRPPHLWDQHDSDRAHTDSVGWAAHFKDCAYCNPKDEALEP